MYHDRVTCEVREALTWMAWWEHHVAASEAYSLACAASLMNGLPASFSIAAL
jgi:hypothetical protein